MDGFAGCRGGFTTVASQAPRKHTKNKINPLENPPITPKEHHGRRTPHSRLLYSRLLYFRALERQSRVQQSPLETVVLPSTQALVQSTTVSTRDCCYNSVVLPTTQAAVESTTVSSPTEVQQSPLETVVLPTFSSKVSLGMRPERDLSRRELSGGVEGAEGGGGGGEWRRRRGGGRRRRRG